MKRSKKEGGKVYIAADANGEVTIHEGWLDAKEAKRLDRAQAKADGTVQPAVRAELSQTAWRYLERLMALTDKQVLRVLAYVMSESLVCGTEIVGTLGSPAR